MTKKLTQLIDIEGKTYTSDDHWWRNPHRGKALEPSTVDRFGEAETDPCNHARDNCNRSVP